MFRVQTEHQSARTGVFRTAHGEIRTPFFMPVATKATVKTLTPRDLYECGVKAIISNSLHLFFRPGTEIIYKHGGLHDFMKFGGIIFTDSGGFQMIREGFLEKITSEGILFRSPYDGRKHFFTPERSRKVQAELGSDVAMMLDFCPPYPVDYETAKNAVLLTTKWARRFSEKKERGQMIFGIVQGSVYENLRKKSASELAEMDFDGYGIGGLSIGEPEWMMNRMLEITNGILPFDKPRYLMGVGSPLEIINAVTRGVDIFDSAFPTRNGRHGTAFTWNGRLNLAKSVYRDDMRAVDEDCNCYTCRTFTRSYIHHLLREKEILGMSLLSLHNVCFMQEFMARIREEIEQGTLEKFKKEIEKIYGKTI